MAENIGRYANETGQKNFAIGGGLRADHRRSSTASLVTDAGRRGRRPLRSSIGKHSVGRGALTPPPIPHRTPRQGTRTLPYKMCGGPMCPAATGTSASPDPQGPYGGQRGKMKKYVIRVRKLLTNGWEHGIIILVLARLAQLVEHMLDVHGVTGSSPVPCTKKSRNLKGSRTFYFCQD